MFNPRHFVFGTRNYPLHFSTAKMSIGSIRLYSQSKTIYHSIAFISNGPNPFSMVFIRFIFSIGNHLPLHPLYIFTWTPFTILSLLETIYHCPWAVFCPGGCLLTFLG